MSWIRVDDNEEDSVGAFSKINSPRSLNKCYGARRCTCCCCCLYEENASDLKKAKDFASIKTVYSQPHFKYAKILWMIFFVCYLINGVLYFVGSYGLFRDTCMSGSVIKKKKNKKTKFVVDPLQYAYIVIFALMLCFNSCLPESADYWLYIWFDIVVALFVAYLTYFVTLTGDMRGDRLSSVLNLAQIVFICYCMYFFSYVQNILFHDGPCTQYTAKKTQDSDVYNTCSSCVHLFYYLFFLSFFFFFKKKKGRREERTVRRYKKKKKGLFDTRTCYRTGFGVLYLITNSCLFCVERINNNNK
ncbi:hypothetical protein RFI_10311 [Reticulomyxa filosa]|uniref:Uncharacterized protein n=1 Tax=Reticulomyxa filosa TaxID=46433 RepID=X6NKH8_RETFI|nr:hypothetical protein RFI_10311 [Reticulomyxa filosa]|eukprot:ETO26820.1 hypothetical protein RFI_10311 [Reticulomyxa filosa]